MKFMVTVLALAGSAISQSVSIAGPTSGQSIDAGQGATGIIQKGGSITPSTTLALPSPSAIVHEPNLLAKMHLKLSGPSSIPVRSGPSTPRAHRVSHLTRRSKDLALLSHRNSLHGLQ